MRDYTHIDAWKLRDDLAVVLYQVTRKFPKEELYGLTSQLRRAAVSVPTNIAEGSARETQKDYLLFLYIARGSLTESQDLVHLATRLGHIDPTEAERLGVETKRAFACLHGLIKAVERQAGKLPRVIATLTSLGVLCIARQSANFA